MQKSYKILCCDKSYTLEYVDKIVVTIINSTTMVIGLISIQIIGIIINQLYFCPNVNTINRIDNYEIDDGQNLNCNLKNNVFAFELIYEEVYNFFSNIDNLISKNFSRWYKIEENGNLIIYEKKERYVINVVLILSSKDERDIYQKFFLKIKIKNIKKSK